MPHRPLAALAALLAIMPLAATAQQEEWTYLFKDATLDDFYFDFIEDIEPEEVFEIDEDATLLITGKDKPIGYLQTLDEYSNYELAFDWRWTDETGEGGLLVHSSTPRYRSVWPQGIEIQLDHGDVGDFQLFGEEIEVEESQEPTKAADRHRRKKLKDEEKRAGSWNEMRIVAEEDTLKVYLNDELVNEGTEASAESGYITIQAQESDLEIRDFRVRQLDE